MTVTIPRPAEISRWLGGQVDVRVEVDTGPGAGLGGLWDSAIWDTGPVGFGRSGLGRLHLLRPFGVHLSGGGTVG